MDNPIVSDEKWLSTIFEYHAIITEVDYNRLKAFYIWLEDIFNE